MLGGAEVVAEHGRVRMDDADQGHALEVVPLGHHLRAHQDVDLARVDFVEHRLRGALAARGVGVDPGDAGVWKTRGEGLLDALRAPPKWRNIDIAAVRAVMRHWRFQPAVVAAQPALRPVQHEVRRATRAAGEPATAIAGQHRRIAAPVQEQQALLAALQPLLDGVQQRHGEPFEQMALALPLMVQVDQTHSG
ncbi:hypothetical protein D3C72_1078170 [compost metagenome]